MRDQVPPATVVARLESLLPGLSDLADARAASTRSKRDATWNRVHPDRPSPFGRVSSAAACLDVDTIVDHAITLGVTVRKYQIRAQDCELGALHCLAQDHLSSADQLVLVVADDQACYQVQTSELEPLIRDWLCDGDLVVVWETAPRIVVVHHEGWLFDLRV